MSSPGAEAAPSLPRLVRALEGVVLGQEGAIADVLTAYLAGGHVLLEGVPGVAKTLLARTLSQCLGLRFTRVQFTPDLMPSDILGTSVFRANTGTFELVRGPVFTEVLVADEINRTPPKTQSALLECMEERQVTLEGKSHPLDPRFFVVATQNPLELEGTYPLPEAQLDRFLMRVKIRYPSEDAELAVVREFHARGQRPPAAEPVLTKEELLALFELARTIRCDESVIRYCVRLARRTREAPGVRLGASPRAAQALLAAAKARGALEGRSFVTPDDVKATVAGVFNHRVVLAAEAEVEGSTPEDIIRRVLDQVEVPR